MALYGYVGLCRIMSDLNVQLTLSGGKVNMSTAPKLTLHLTFCASVCTYSIHTFK